MNYNIIDLPDLELLSEEETRHYIELAQRDDDKALEKLVEHNLRLVLKVTYRFRNTVMSCRICFRWGNRPD